MAPGRGLNGQASVSSPRPATNSAALSLIGMTRRQPVDWSRTCEGSTTLGYGEHWKRRSPMSRIHPLGRRASAKIYGRAFDIVEPNARFAMRGASPNELTQAPTALMVDVRAEAPVPYAPMIYPDELSDSLFAQRNSPQASNKFPVPIHREFRCKPLILGRGSAEQSAHGDWKARTASWVRPI